jgi:hypothetical protein
MPKRSSGKHRNYVCTTLVPMPEWQTLEAEAEGAASVQRTENTTSTSQPKRPG